MSQWQPPQQPWQPGQPQPGQWQPQQPPYTQPYAPQPWQSMPPGQPMQPQPPKKRRIWLWALAAVIVVSLVSTMLGNAISQNSAAQPTMPAMTPTTPAVIHYPPKTIGDLHGLAAKGNAAAIHTFSSESVGLVGACPQPKRDTTIDPGITGQQFAEDLLAYFYGQQLDSPCGSVVFVEHSQSDAGNGYTAGRIYFDTTDASGQENTDPNATGLTHKLILDIGGSLDAKEYVVIY